jgi:hypothetical protein
MAPSSAVFWPLSDTVVRTTKVLLAKAWSQKTGFEACEGPVAFGGQSKTIVSRCSAQILGWR